MKTLSILSVTFIALLLIGCGEQNPANESADQAISDAPASAQPSLETLEKAIEKNDALAVEDAFDQINQAGNAKAAIPLLINGLKYGNDDVRETCSKKLQNLAGMDNEPVKALMVALEDQDPVVRLRVATALGEIGPPAAEAVPALDQLQRNEVEESDVRKAATEALQRINEVPTE